MRKSLTLLLLAGLMFSAIATPAGASTATTALPPVDGGYVRCPDNSLISELGVRFQHPAYPGNPTVLHVLPSISGRSLGEELLEAITPSTRPSNRTKWLSFGQFIPGINLIAVPAVGISYLFDIADSRDNKFAQYIVDFYDCLRINPYWVSHMYSIFFRGQLSDLGVKSWKSIELQLLCHAAGAAIPDLGNFLGGLTWDLEGHVGDPVFSIDPLDVMVISGCQWDKAPFSWIPTPWG